MEKLPHSLLLQILSRLDDSAGVARCRVACKAFDTVFSGLRSINLRYSHEWFSRSSSSQRIKPLKTVFLDLISKLENVESVSVVDLGGHDFATMCSRFFDVDHESDNFTFTDGDYANKWLPRVSSSLKSLSISSYVCCNPPIVDLPLISTYCQNLVILKLEFVQLSSMHDMNPMPMLTSLTIGSTILEEEHLHELNKCFPNLQVLDLVEVSGLRKPMIHHLKLKTCYADLSDNDPLSLTLITPNLVNVFPCQRSHYSFMVMLLVLYLRISCLSAWLVGLG